jgi:hypothetical protein
MERRDYDYCEANASNISLTSSTRNAIILKWLRDGDDNLKCLCIQRGQIFYDNFTFREGDDLAISLAKVDYMTSIFGTCPKVKNVLMHSWKVSLGTNPFGTQILAEQWWLLVTLLRNITPILDCLALCCHDIIGYEAERNIAETLGHIRMKDFFLESTNLDDDGLASIIRALCSQSHLERLAWLDHNHLAPIAMLR